MPHSPRPAVVPAPILVPALYGRCLIALVRKRGICQLKTEVFVPPASSHFHSFLHGKGRLPSGPCMSRARLPVDKLFSPCSPLHVRQGFRAGVGESPREPFPLWRCAATGSGSAWKGWGREEQRTRRERFHKSICILGGRRQAEACLRQP
ncbi:unnamed protein product [Pleuronectes platessa]|uniref:Uncharacterized protein n=1 Tax=Pleuronectes platessa TaxID=8262 RepID=A0A9N7Z3Z4_PLEPL|nr:unnamed protein product [Pleuronectes platessa]